MGDVGIGIKRVIQDVDGEAATVTSGKLDVNATLVNSDDINIGNVVLQTDAGADIYAGMAITDVIPNLDQGTLLGTHALLSARSASDTTLGITCEDSTHNALHVAISDGAGIANVDANNALLVDVVAGGVLESAVDGIEGLLTTIDADTGNLVGLGGCVGTDGGSSPAKCLNVSGTTSLGYSQELLCDNNGHLQIDVLTAPSTAVTNAGTFVTQIDGDALTALQLIDDAIYTDDDDFTANSSKGIVVMGYNYNSQNITAGDVGAITVDEHGQVRTVQNLGEPDTFAMIDVDNAVESLNSTVGTFTDCIEIILQADEDNTGYIMVGDGDVADNRGIKMNAGDTFILTAVDSRLISLWGSADNQNLRCMIMRQDI